MQICDNLIVFFTFVLPKLQNGKSNPYNLPLFATNDTFVLNEAILIRQKSHPVFGYDCC